MIVRDYMYLDTERVQDYMASLGPGIADEFKETITEGSGAEGEARVRAGYFALGGKGQTREESTYEATYKLKTQHWFHRIYEALDESGSITKIEDDECLDVTKVKKRQLVEITRQFSPSPLNQMIDKVFQLTELMNKMGMTEQFQNRETQEAINFMTMVFRSEHDETDVPMVAKGDGRDASVIFTARSTYILKSQVDFVGDMTVFGRVLQKTPASSPFNLLDLLRMPPGLQGNEATIQNLVVDLFKAWPEDLGGPMDENALQVPGPALLVAPVAVYL